MVLKCPNTGVIQDFSILQKTTIQTLALQTHTQDYIGTSMFIIVGQQDILKRFINLVLFKEQKRDKYCLWFFNRNFLRMVESSCTYFYQRLRGAIVGKIKTKSLSVSHFFKQFPSTTVKVHSRNLNSSTRTRHVVR